MLLSFLSFCGSSRKLNPYKYILAQENIFWKWKQPPTQYECTLLFIKLHWKSTLTLPFFPKHIVTQSDVKYYLKGTHTAHWAWCFYVHSVQATFGPSLKQKTLFNLLLSVADTNSHRNSSTLLHLGEICIVKWLLGCKSLGNLCIWSWWCSLSKNKS